ncbi:MAG: ATP-binding protein, partial [Treponema sp.]|nr:ATP-binding protein [Treponema sp.]
MTEVTLLEHIAAILELSKDNGLDEPFFENARTHLDAVSAELHITPVQAALFAHVFDTSVMSRRMGEETLFHSLKCSKFKYLEYLNDIDELVKLNYVIQILDNSGMSKYKIPREFILALRKGKPLRPESYVNISIDKFFLVLQKYFRRRYNDEMLLDELINALQLLMENNPHLEFTRRIRNYDLSADDTILLLYFCSKLVNEDEEVNFACIEKQFSDDDAIFVTNDYVRQLKDGTNALQKLELIENSNNEGFAIKDVYCLTEKAKDDLLEELKTNKKTNKNRSDFISSADIAEKNMFYNPGEEEKIRDLTNLLEQENFRNIEERLEESGLRKGFACLFSGLPGTGKTETVYQIARKTGRDIVMVDISRIKSMWVGQSEKQIKAVFVNYKKLQQSEEITPILFFNEADAIIGRRMEFNANSRAVDQMENSIQNIILQELENLSGILIATTNLTQNMDKAFERRFLYKIEFEKPDVQAKKAIWKSMISELSDDDAYTLAARFDFSG